MKRLFTILLSLLTLWVSNLAFAQNEPVITSVPDTIAVVDEDYEYRIQATGQPKPRYAILEGPEEMEIRRRSGRIEWEPEDPGVYKVELVAFNSQGSTSQSFLIHVYDDLKAPKFERKPSKEGLTGQPYVSSASASGIPIPTYSLLDGPSGMLVDSNSGEITWQEPTLGEHEVTIAASNAAGTKTHTYELEIQRGVYPPAITSTPGEIAFINEPYTYTVTSEANPGARYHLVDAPSAMRLDSLTGIIAWTPADTGRVEVSLEAVNPAGRVEQSFVVTVYPESVAPQITSTPLSFALLGTTYSYAVEVNGSPSPLLALEVGPPGMTLNAAFGILSWTPEATGDFDIILSATNIAGAVLQQFTIRVDTPGSAPLLYPPTVEFLGPTEVQLNLQVNPNGNETRLLVDFGRVGSDTLQIEPIPAVIDGLTQQLIKVPLTNLEEETTYFFRATAESRAGNIVGAVQTFTTLAQSMQIGTSHVFDGQLDSLDYRLFSIPGAIALDAAATVNGVQHEDWGIFRDNGRTSNFFEPYTPNELFQFKPGRGFWVLAKSNWTVAPQTIETASINSAGQFDLPLQAGWNIIASPYQRPVSWKQVLGSSPDISPTSKVWTYKGSFTETEALLPYEAYYFFNDGPASTTLRIPFPSSTQDDVVAKQAASKSSPYLTIQAFFENHQTSRVEILFDSEASEELDRLDQYAPRSAFSSSGLRILPRFEAPYGHLALDVRPPGEEGYAYDVLLQPPSEASVPLRITGLSDFSDQQVVLVDRLTGAIHDLHQNADLILHSAHPVSRYTVLIGSAGFIAGSKEELIPEHVELYPAYPNPFKDAVTFEFSLAESTGTQLVIFDALGRQLAFLDRGTKEAGHHQITWGGRSPSGSELPSGVYFIQLRTDTGDVQTRRIVKLR